MQKEKNPSQIRKFLYFLRRDRKTRLLTIAGAAGLLVLAAAAGFLLSAALDPYDCRILPNVRLGGIDVGGMTRREARAALEEEIDYSSEDMVVALPRETLYLSPEETGIRLDTQAAVAAAYALGREGTPEEKQHALEEGKDLSLLPFLRIKEDFIIQQLEAYAEKYNVAYAEPAFSLSGPAPALEEDAFDPEAPCQTLLITAGTSQISLDVAGTLELIQAAYGAHRFLVEIPRIPPEKAAASVDLDAIYQQVCVAPVNTGVDLQTFQLIPGSYGYDFDLPKAKQLLATAAPGQTFSFPMRYVVPEVLGDEAYFQDVLGSCETPHTADENRNTNLRLACASLDGLILQPGETFSYNQTLGERTKDRGYKPAPAYSGLDLVPSYGGGICQGSSTLYYCTLLADLEILERVNHGYVAKYIQIGCDATVSWWGPDFRFRNNTNFPIMIRAEVSDGYVKMQLLGTDEKDYYVEMESETRGYATSGYYVKTYKLRYDKETGELISRDYEAASSYRPSYY